MSPQRHVRSGHQLGGHPDPLHDPFRNHRAGELDPRRGTGRMLLQVDGSNRDDGDPLHWYWGDCRLHFVIDRSDLRARRFDQARVSMQCT